jgi:hypothetical protein
LDRADVDDPSAARPQAIDKGLCDCQCTDHTDFQLLAQIADRHEIQWAAANDSSIIDDPGQRTVADLGARGGQLRGHGHVELKRRQAAAAKPFGVFLTSYSGQYTNFCVEERNVNTKRPRDVGRLWAFWRV